MTLPKPYYRRGGITIYHGDCRELAAPLAGSADLVFADPPYGVGKAAWDGAFQTDWMEAYSRVAPVLAVTPGLWNLLRCPPQIGPLTYRWTLAVHLVNGMTRGAIGFGNWIACVVYGGPTARLYRAASDIKDIALGRWPRPAHPSPKPLDAMSWFLGRLPTGSIVDPFAGSGTTLLAALLAGRTAIGIELDESYCELAARRCDAEFTAKRQRKGSAA